MLMKKRRAALVAGGAMLGVVVVGAALVLWPEEMRNDSVSRDPPPQPPAQIGHFPPPPVAPIHPAGRRNGDPAVDAGVEEESPALCDGCLTERAVLDVVETYLRQLDPVYLHGELRAHPLADIAPETPGLIYGQPKLPPDLLEVPEKNPMGMIIDSRSYPVEATWIVWVQTGWWPHHVIENQVRSGSLPEVALSWPPIKEEAFVAVDSQTGKLHPDGIFDNTSAGLWPPLPPHYDAVLEATHDRVARWLRGGGRELGSS